MPIRNTGETRGSTTERNGCWFADICSDGIERCHFEALIVGAVSCDSIAGMSCVPEESECPDA